MIVTPNQIVADSLGADGHLIWVVCVWTGHAPITLPCGVRGQRVGHNIQKYFACEFFLILRFIIIIIIQQNKRINKIKKKKIINPRHACAVSVTPVCVCVCVYVCVCVCMCVYVCVCVCVC